MPDDLITCMAEAAYKRRIASIGGDNFPTPFSGHHSVVFQAEVRAEMEMLRDMVLTEIARAKTSEDAVKRGPGKAAPVLGRRSVRKWRFSLF